MKKDAQTKKKLLRSPLLWGVLTSLLLTSASLQFPDNPLLQNATMWVGAICLLISMVLSGTLVSGDRARANTAYETSEDRHLRNKAIGILLKFGLPHLLVFLLPYLLERL